VKLAYVVSRFPLVTETFILRELNQVADEPDLDVELFTLFPSETATVHPAAQRWMPRVHRGSGRAAMGGMVAWLVRRPVRLAGCFAAVLLAHLRQPDLAARNLLAVAIATGHARSAARLGVCHLHAHYATYPAVCAWVVHRLTGASYSFTAHAHDIYVNSFFLGRLLRDARFVNTISHFNRGYLTAHGDPRGTPIHALRCGVDLDALPFAPRVPPAEGPVHALCVASLQTYKGHRILFEALASERALDRIRLELVGDGPLGVELKSRAAALGLADRVTFHGAQTEQEVARLLGEADLFVLPSIVDPDTAQMEGLPNALIEALAVGAPVVTTRLAGIPELVRDGVTGLLAEPGDPDGLRTALQRTLVDPQGARDRVYAGRLAVEAEFDLRTLGAGMAALLRAQAG
jgi:glycosyltransferase involved in cell wall biosynthesis